MDSLVGSSIIKVFFENEYYQYKDSLPDPCFKCGTRDLVVETSSGELYRFQPVNDRWDYELGIWKIDKPNVHFSSADFSEQWTTVFNSPIVSQSDITIGAGNQVVAIKLTFQNKAELFIMCGDYEYNEIAKDFILFPGSSGILIFFDADCFVKYASGARFLT